MKYRTSAAREKVRRLELHVLVSKLVSLFGHQILDSKQVQLVATVLASPCHQGLKIKLPRF